MTPDEFDHIKRWEDAKREYRRCFGELAAAQAEILECQTGLGHIVDQSIARRKRAEAAEREAKDWQSKYNARLALYSIAEQEVAHHRETLRQIMAWEGPSAFKHVHVPLAEATCQWCNAITDEWIHQDDFYERHA